MRRASWRADRPKQVGMLRVAGDNELAVGGNDVCGPDAGAAGTPPPEIPAKAAVQQKAAQGKSDDLAEGRFPTNFLPTAIDGIRPKSQVRTGLPAGGRWIRTLGPSRKEPRSRALIKRNSLTIIPPHFRLGSIPYASRESRE